MGFARSVVHLALLRGLQGLLTGYQSASNALVAATVPRNLAGGALGFLRTGTWIGVGLGPLCGGFIGELWGIRQSFWITGGLLGLASLLVALYVKETFIPPAIRRRGMLSTYRELLRVPALLHLYSISFLDSLARSAMLPIFPLYVRKLTGGDDSADAPITGLLLGLRALAGALASHHVGRAGDRLGHGRVVSIATMILFVLYVPQPALTAVWQLVTLHVLIGFAAVGLVPGVAALFALAAPEGQQGATFALESSIDGLGRSIGPMVGALVASLFGIRAVFAFVALVYLGLVFAAWPLRKQIADATNER
jgi:DHA1 family multidrug resistance protein-like MFS transporter